MLERGQCTRDGAQGQRTQRRHSSFNFSFFSFGVMIEIRSEVKKSHANRSQMHDLSVRNKTESKSNQSMRTLTTTFTKAGLRLALIQTIKDSILCPKNVHSSFSKAQIRVDILSPKRCNRSARGASSNPYLLFMHTCRCL